MNPDDFGLRLEPYRLRLAQQPGLGRQISSPWFWLASGVAIILAITLTLFVLPDDSLAQPNRLHTLFILFLVCASSEYFVLSVAAIRARILATQRRIEKSENALGKTSGTGTRDEESAQEAYVQPAWDLARDTLEQYWQRNSIQNWLIFCLSVVATVAGFIVMCIGAESALYGKSVSAAIVASASGVFTQFIGATFLIVYRSTMQQMTTFNQTLERINSVGMAWYIVESMSEATDPDRYLRNRLMGALALKVANPSAEFDTGTDLLPDSRSANEGVHTESSSRR